MTREDIIRMAREAGITRCTCKSSTCDMLHSAATFAHLEKFSALVSAAERKPLTEEEIDQIAIKCLASPVFDPGWNRNLARAIELAHGIR